MRRRGIGRRSTGLLGSAARTAVIAGTATAVSGRVAASQSARAVPEPAAQGPSASTSVLSDEAVAHLKQLAELRDAGVLTEDEFSAQKAKLLGS